MIKELFHRQKLRDLFDAHSQVGNNTEQPLSGEHVVVNVLRSFSNTLSESMSAESSEVLKVPTNACVWSELSDEESINCPFQRSLGDDMVKEDPEINKGETHSYDIDQGFDDDIDSDVFLEEKIQRVLGHFRKDFEGGITAENLGATFGGYGSFLPSYERKLKEGKA